MGISRSRINRNDNLTWPGFVDSLAALLMVVIFVLMIFSVAQFYLNQIVSGQDEALVDLNIHQWPTRNSYAHSLVLAIVISMPDDVLHTIPKKQACV